MNENEMWGVNKCWHTYYKKDLENKNDFLKNLKQLKPANSMEKQMVKMTLENCTQKIKRIKEIEKRIVRCNDCCGFVPEHIQLKFREEIEELKKELKELKGD